MKVLCGILICVASLLFVRCTSAPVAGGTTDTGNARVSAVIFTDAGVPAAGATVTICPEGYIASIGTDSAEVRETSVRTLETDAEGMFRIDTIADGNYIIEVNDGVAEAVLIHCGLSDSGDAELEITDTMRLYATVDGNAGVVNDETLQRFCVVHDLDRVVPVYPDGMFLIDDLPPGQYHLSIVAAEPSWQTVEFDSVDAQSDDTVSVTTADTTVPVYPGSRMIVFNTAAGGAGVDDTVFGFPVLVRLSDANFPFDSVDTDSGAIRFVKQNGTVVPFSVESWEAGAAAIWVLLDTLFGNDSTQHILLQWGASIVDSAKSDSPVFDTSLGFLAGYHLGGSLTDVTVNEFDGIDSGTTDAPDGIIGRGRSFNGSSQFFSVRGLPDRINGTFSFWFRPRATFNAQSTPTQGIWGKYISDGTDYSISLRSSDYYTGLPTNSYGSLVAKLEDQDTGYYLASTEISFSAGEWYHVACIWNEESGNRLYVNGELAEESSLVIPVHGDAPDEIGRCRYDTKNIPYGPILYFRGTLDEVRFETASRDSAWIRLCYVNQRTDDALVRVLEP
jgi:hypothetical protein